MLDYFVSVGGTLEVDDMIGTSEDREASRRSSVHGALRSKEELLQSNQRRNKYEIRTLLSLRPNYFFYCLRKIPGYGHRPVSLTHRHTTQPTWQ